MVRDSLSASQGGPSATADWMLFDQGPSGGRNLHALPAMGAEGSRGDCGRELLYLAAAPALSRAPGSGRPQLGLTLIVERAPALDDHFLSLVTGAVLSIDLTIAPTSEELDRVADQTGRQVRPLFVRKTDWRLSNSGSEEVVATAELHGGGGSAAISQTVSRETALAVLAALRGDDSGILVSCEAEFRAASGEAVTVNRLATAAGATTISMTTTQMGALRRVSLENSLEDILRNTNGVPLDAVVSAVCPSTDGTLQPVPLQQEETRQPRGPAPPTGYAAIGDSLAALPAVLKTSRASRINAHALAASGIASHLGRLNRWQLADIVIHPPGSEEQNQNLPLIEADAPLWPDRADPQRYWYAPQFSIRMPQPTMDASNSPFRFGFSVVGHDSDGKPTLEAHARITLDSGMAEATRTAWESLGKPGCDPAPANGLSANLILPFVDENGTRTETSVSATNISPVDGGVEVSFALTDRFARLAYGVLGTPGFQASSARVDVAYCFPAYVPVEPSRSRLLWGGKSATIDERAARRPFPGLAAITAHHAAAGLIAAQPHIAAAHAVLLEPAIFVRPKTYGIRTQGRSQAIDAFIPCSTFGALYVQEGEPDTAEAARPIGCLDAWTLGQIKLRLYEPLDIDLGIQDPPYSLYRSVQVPGRFLVLPKAYTITRYEPSDWHGSRPALYLYSNVDAVHPENTSCILTGTLRPALTPADRQLLIDALRDKAHGAPTLEWPTDLAVEPQFSWALPGGSAKITASAVQTPEGFQVSLGAPVDQILTLKSLVETSGVTGSVSFRLADGSNFQSTLSIDLARIDGPFEAGAVSVAVQADRLELTNNTEAAADVGELLLYDGGIRVGEVPVERRIEPHEKVPIDAPAGQAGEAVATYRLIATGGSLEEIRTFVEDLHTNAVFICAFDLAAEQVQKVTVEAQIAGVSGAGTVELLPDRTSGEIGFVLPLTAYLGQPTLHYRTTALLGDGGARTSQWRDWRLDLQGNVVELQISHIKEG